MCKLCFWSTQNQVWCCQNSNSVHSICQHFCVVMTFSIQNITVRSVIFLLPQVPFRMATNSFGGTNIHPLQIRPSHYYLRLWGIKEPYIVAGAYLISCFLTLLAGYLGLVSAQMKAQLSFFHCFLFQVCDIIYVLHGIFFFYFCQGCRLVIFLNKLTQRRILE